jgi:hypothetical protein
VLERMRIDLSLWIGATAAVAVVVGCGGASSDPGSVPGSSHASASGAGWDGDAGVEGEVDAEPEPPAVTFVLENTHPDEDLVFSLDRGWQPVIFAYSGEPPNATPIIMFPKHCTAACDAEAEEICPDCPEPTNVQDIKAAQQREVVAPGETLEVPWDGEVFVYGATEGTRDGKPVSCDCYDKEPVPEETYTVRACGFRVTTEPNRPSTYQCVQGEMTLPADEPLVVELEFPVPEQPARRGRRGRR